MQKSLHNQKNTVGKLRLMISKTKNSKNKAKNKITLCKPVKKIKSGLIENKPDTIDKRRLKNRESAERCRLKKKREIDFLKKEIEKL